MESQVEQHELTHPTPDAVELTAVLAACGYTLGQPPVRAPGPKEGEKKDAK